MLSFESVSKELGGREVLRGISFEVSRGSSHTILGPTGSGKTVTLRHIVKLLEPDEGVIKFDGVDIGNFRGRALENYRSRFGYLFQSGALIEWMSVEENVGLPLKERFRLSGSELRKRVSEALELVGMKDSEKLMPAELSGGMRKRVGLARAIVTRPEILLFDEPTSGLDPIMSRRIDHVIGDLKKVLGITVIIVTHDLISAFSLSERISMISDGRIIFDGSVEEFKRCEDEFVKKFIQAQIPCLDNEKISTKEQ